ncbi:hypothetical protein D7B24_004491 [Verticillium nonalfalfae]|uniref:Uncharacterized protein n=1 Tax=Verticillium nonalfalfae TaxID=1051616 RepID=A0A3M9YHM8_9PEZI|nr:uncharacterized protein D7B24_004491 [Verticillium nonalfalfae]RNJ58620.1 hypothetical protein D7B24_004491 [Verticillium nonalfalfae]
MGSNFSEGQLVHYSSVQEVCIVVTIYQETRQIVIRTQESGQQMKVSEDQLTPAVSEVQPTPAVSEVQPTPGDSVPRAVKSTGT